MNEVQTLIDEISKHWGWEVGDKVRQEINAVIAAQDVDIDQLQSAIETIQGLLDADPNTPEFDVGQNIVTQLSDHLNRITGLETDVNRLKGDETTVGSVAYAVKQERDRATAVEAGLQSSIDTINGDETVDGSVAKKVKTAVDNEAATRQAADANLQAQIDDLSGGSNGSIASVQAEVDAVEAGAGLNDDGTYTANANANYISDATSLKDADDKLDAAMKGVSDDIAAETAARQAADQDIQNQIAAVVNDGNAAAAAIQSEIDATQTGAGLNDDGSYATKSDANYIADATSLKDSDEKLDAAIKSVSDSVAAEAERADATFVSKQQIANISAVTLASIFRQALDCGFAGESKDDVLNGTGNCQTANGNGGNGGDGGDGAVI